MQFLRTPKEREPPSPAAGLGSTTGFYELSMYKDSPVGEVALEEFEKVALDRLRSEFALLLAGERARSADGQEGHALCSVS